MDWTNYMMRIKFDLTIKCMMRNSLNAARFIPKIIFLRILLHFHMLVSPYVTPMTSQFFSIIWWLRQCKPYIFWMHIINHWDHLDHLNHLKHMTNQRIFKKNNYRICIVYFVILFKYAFIFAILGEGSSLQNDDTIEWLSGWKGYGDISPTAL